MRGRRAGGAITLWALCGLVAGGCSGTAGATRAVATFDSVDRAASAVLLAGDARELTVRLRALGDSGATVAVKGHTVVVSGGTRLPVPASLLLAPGTLQIRPALCQARPYVGAAPGTVAGTLPSACSSARYSVQAPTLTVDVSMGTTNLASIPPDPVLAAHPSSSSPAYDDSHPDGSVLVPVSGEAGVRYLLGPTVLGGSAVAGAQAAFQNPQWVVNVTLTGPGASAWDALTRKYFHEFIAVDVDGRALSVPIVQPTQVTFTSFGGRMQIGGVFTRPSADALAADLDSGPLATALSP